MIEVLEGIVISELDYKESSKIVNILCKEYGVIGVICKGCKKLKSNYKISKLTYAKMHIKYKENSLSTLVDLDIINNFKNIKKDLIKSSYSNFILELSHQVYKHDQDNNIYDLLINSLIKIEEGLNPKIITNILELKLLDNLGIRPILDYCVNCNTKSNIITISSYKGGLLCNKCLNNEKIYDNKTIKLIRMFYYVDISKLTKLDISDNIVNEIDSFIDDYYDRYSGLYLKSKQFLKNIKEFGSG